VKGYLWTRAQAGVPQARRADWEAIAVDAVGNTIEFWGFKRNQGRVWALLFLRDVALTAAEIEKELQLSKGGVSMLLRDLERWGVVLRVRSPHDSAWRYRAETDLLKMARRVIEEREFAFIARVRADLEEAIRLAETDSKTSKAKVARLKKMERLAEATEEALRLFLKTSRLDVGALFGVFKTDERR
jgi:DNA-binding transcriptional regulator GbsR (MarR family)